MTRLRAVVFVSLLFAVGSVTLAGLALAGGPDPDEPTRAELVGVNFVSHCDTSHRAPDDPIVFPGQAGPLARPHLRRQHDDERLLDAQVAAPVADDLRARRATPPRTGCRRSSSAAQTVLPRGATIYYRRRTLDDGARRSRPDCR